MKTTDDGNNRGRAQVGQAGVTGALLLTLLVMSGIGEAGRAEKKTEKPAAKPYPGVQAGAALPAGERRPPPPVVESLPLEDLEQALPQPVVPPKYTQGVVIWRGNPNRKEVALTFDDGPHPPFTQRLLRLLQELDVKATFFVVGKKLDLCPELIVQMVREGHEVANHTYHHINLGKVSVAEAQHEIWLNNAAIRRACGQSPKCFRPPGGHHEPNVLQAADNMKMTTMLWTDDPADFAYPGEAVIEARLLGHIRSGAVILLHDGVDQTLNILPDLIARLRREGYRFVTASEMVAHMHNRTPLLARARHVKKGKIQLTHDVRLD